MPRLRSLAVKEFERFHSKNCIGDPARHLISKRLWRPKNSSSPSTSLKIRDRDSYEFALASAAIGLDLDGGLVRQARIALGGVATVPWRAHEAEQCLTGQQ